MVARIGVIAYKLDLLATSKIHLIFHVLQLKQHIGLVLSQSSLPLVDDTGAIAKEPISIIDRRIMKRGNKAVIEVLV